MYIGNIRFTWIDDLCLPANRNDIVSINNNNMYIAVRK